MITDPNYQGYHKTAITRRTPSAGLRNALRHGLIQKDDIVLDYGCGRGDDVMLMQEMGIDVTGYDPHLPLGHPYGLMNTEPVGQGKYPMYSTVLLTYVLNVIRHPDERATVVGKALAYLKVGGSLVVTVRTDDPADTTKWQACGDGYITSTGTFQTFYSGTQLRDWLQIIIALQSALTDKDFYIDHAEAGYAVVRRTR